MMEPSIWQLENVADNVEYRRELEGRHRGVNKSADLAGWSDDSVKERQITWL